MTYNTGFVAVVKWNGKILREDKDLVFLPFGSEYSILLKNLNSRKCLVKISIDGQDVLDSNSLILEPNTEIELEGFMKGMKAKNKFKFIKKTKEISDYRGDRIDDGIIRIEYWFEKIVKRLQIINEYIYTPYYNYDLISNSTQWHQLQYGTSLKQNTLTGDKVSSNLSSSVNLNSVNFVQDEGITVKGSEINQNFSYGHFGQPEDYSNVIILRLIGSKKNGEVIKTPITTKTKKICSTCGKKSKSNLKYCSNCGTFLD